MPAPPANLTPSTLPSHSSLSATDVQQLASIYEATLLATPQQKRHRVEPKEMLRLDKLRYSEIPSTIASRGKQRDHDSSNAKKQTKKWSHGFATKSELQDLMSWKLARGVYRPVLPGLIAQNDAKTVEDVTGEGFAEYGKIIDGGKDGGGYRNLTPKAKASKPALDILCRLKGVGPATASLLLSAAFPAQAPFFSDEIYYFFAAGQPARLEKIRYNLAEYSFVEESLQAVQQQQTPNLEQKDTKSNASPIRADDIERATFVIQKLHNPDVWAAAFGPEAAREGELGAAEAIDRIVDEKDGKLEERKEGGGKGKGSAAKKDQAKKRKSVQQDGEEPQIAGLEEAHPPTDMDPTLSEKQREKVRSIKKETIKRTGGTIKHVDPELPPKKRRRELDGQEEGLRRSGRTRQATER